MISRLLLWGIINLCNSYALPHHLIKITIVITIKIIKMAELYQFELNQFEDPPYQYKPPKVIIETIKTGKAEQV